MNHRPSPLATAIVTCTILMSVAAQPLIAAEGQLKQSEFETKVTLSVKMNHWVYLPPNYDERDDWPLIVFLHGAGERGDDLNQVKVHGPPKLVAEGHDLPFIIVAPQCERSQRWYADAVANLTKSIIKEYKVDSKRIYLTGLSMGGYGTWSTVAKHPDLFAAIVPICGGGDPATVASHTSVPTWVFHGCKDTAVVPERSEEMVTALSKAGGNVRLTMYTEAGHDSWTETYNNPALYDWLLKHSK